MIFQFACTSLTVVCAVRSSSIRHGSYWSGLSLWRSNDVRTSASGSPRWTKTKPCQVST
jgi:hypothetical protein